MLKDWRSLLIWKNLEDQINENFDKGQNSQNDEVQANPLTMELQTPAKSDNVNKRALSKVTDMDIDGISSSKRIRIDKGKEIIDLEIEKWSIIQGGTTIVEEEHSMPNTGGKSASEGKSETVSPSTFQIQKHPYLDA